MSVCVLKKKKERNVKGQHFSSSIKLLQSYQNSVYTEYISLLLRGEERNAAESSGQTQSCKVPLKCGEEISVLWKSTSTSVSVYLTFSLVFIYLRDDKR